ncbi:MULTISPECIES: thioredoxin family protein [unclassified Sphingobium]|uniref:thioredoxin family protein n=1 Tax=unclassified Sphingobium TaxID=2611147 RepID=UPI00119AF0CB|nr:MULTISPECIES: thioredoxin family protein [unclassified Sphingobium]MBG6120502.1 thioredoxin [Sphingobium sp. JAI105]TWC98151.1 thioredoxin 1 [Sphingobium sp. AEW010]TWD17864.1 thioredoxin 1 [Sphingobium sp. AEW013]TWD20625.1 thioredoxin 1 [Sphingobium sp. AEW001]
MTTITPVYSNTLNPNDNVAGEQLELLLFSATWCRPCKALAPVVDDIAQSYASELVITKVDIEASPDIAQAFVVRAVPTLVLRRGEAEIDRHVGILTRARLALMIDGGLADRDMGA